jgi:hypothetical protein
VRGHGDRDRGTAADRARHRIEGLDQHPLPAVRGAVGGDQWHRVADPIHETAQHQAWLVQVRIFSRHPHLRGAIIE